MRSLSAILLWATSVKECGSAVTTKCVIDEETTGPTEGIYHCDPKNVPKLTTSYDDIK